MPHPAGKQLWGGVTRSHNGCADLSRMLHYALAGPGKRGATLCQAGCRAEGEQVMRKLLSLAALVFAAVVAVQAYAPRANAAVLPAGVASLAAEKNVTIQKAYYGCHWTDEGYRRCGYRHRHWRGGYWGHHHWRRHHYWRHHYWRRHHWRGHRYWRGSADDYGYRPYYQRRHYYYRSYYSGYRPGLYRNCIGICWW